MGILGTPSEYEAFIVHGPSGATKMQIPWMNIEHQRILNGFSQASVVVAGEAVSTQCAQGLNNIIMWEDLLVIYRDGHCVWDGPCFGLSQNGYDVTVSATDRSAIVNKRLVGADRDYHGLVDDMYTVVTNLLNDANVLNLLVTPYSLTLASNYYGYPTTLSQIGVTIEGSFRVQRLETVGKILGDLVQQAQLSHTCVCDNMHIGDFALRPYRSTVTEYAGRISEDTIIDTLNVGVDASNLVTQIYRGTTGQGVAGFPNYVGDTYNTYSNYSLQGMQSDAQVGLGYFVDVAGAPFFPFDDQTAQPVVQLSEVQLAPSYGGSNFADDLSSFLPGSIVPIDFPDHPILQRPITTFYAGGFYSATNEEILNARIEQINFSVSASNTGLEERVTMSLTAAAVDYPIL